MIERPIKRALRDPVDEAMVQRIRARMGAAARRPSPQSWALIAATAMLAAIVIGLAIRPAPPAADPGPLQVVERFAPSSPLLSRAPAIARWSDGSKTSLFPGAELVPLENSGRAMAFLLSAGRAHFEVTPHGPRRWSIECGLATIEVVGTRFWLDRDAQRVRIDVEEGVVLVRGERVQDRVQRLTAGESLEVEAGSVALATPPIAPAAAAAADAAPPAAAIDVALKNAPPATPPSPRAPAARELPPPEARAPLPADAVTPANPPASAQAPPSAQAPAPAPAKAELPEIAPPEPAPAPPATPPPSAAQLMQLADAARAAGRSAEAAELLSRLIASHPEDPVSGLAAFTLGRIQIEALSDPLAAAAAFEQAIRLGLPSALEDDCQARMAEALQRGGARARAQAAARRYLELHPGGRSAALMRAIAQ